MNQNKSFLYKFSVWKIVIVLVGLISQRYIYVPLEFAFLWIILGFSDNTFPLLLVWLFSTKMGGNLPRIYYVSRFLAFKLKSILIKSFGSDLHFSNCFISIFILMNFFCLWNNSISREFLRSNLTRSTQKMLSNIKNY